MPNLSALTFVALGLTLAGCAEISPPQRLSAANPANPKAAEAGYPAAGPVLMAGTNYAMRPPAEEKPMEMSEGGSMPMKMPPPEGGKKAAEKPAEHQHNPPKQ